MKAVFQRLHAFLARLFKGILGIYIEILFTAVVMIAGFMICAFWWGIYQ